MIWRYFLVMGVTAVLIEVEGNTAPPSLYSCIDWECEDWISQGKTQQRYVGKTDKHLSFQKNQDILIISKPVDKNQLDWVGKMGNKVGLVPREMVKEEKMSKSTTKFKLDLQEIFDLVGIADADDADDEEEAEDGDDEEQSSSETDGVEIEDIELDNSGEIGNEKVSKENTALPAQDAVPASAATPSIPAVIPSSGGIESSPESIVETTTPTIAADSSLLTQTTTSFQSYQQQSTSVPFEPSLLQNFHPAPAGLPLAEESQVVPVEQKLSHSYPEEEIVALSSGGGESISMESEEALPELVPFSPPSVIDSLPSVTLHPSTDTVLQGGASSTVLDDYYLKETPKTPEPPQQSPSVAVEDQITPRIPDTVILDTMSTIIRSQMGSVSSEEQQHPIMEPSEAIIASKVETIQEAISTPSEKETQFTLQYIEEKTREPLKENISITSDHTGEILEEGRNKSLGSGEDLTLEDGAVVSPGKVELLQPYKLSGMETDDKVEAEILLDHSSNDVAGTDLKSETTTTTTSQSEVLETVTSSDQDQAKTESNPNSEHLLSEKDEPLNPGENAETSVVNQQDNSQTPASSVEKPVENSLHVVAVQENAGTPTNATNVDVGKETPIVPQDEPLEVSISKDMLLPDSPAEPAEPLSPSSLTDDQEEIENQPEKVEDPTPSPSLHQGEVSSEDIGQKVEEELVDVLSIPGNGTLSQDPVLDEKESSITVPVEDEETKDQVVVTPPQTEENVETVAPEADNKGGDAESHIEAETIPNASTVSSPNEVDPPVDENFIGDIPTEEEPDGATIPSETEVILTPEKEMETVAEQTLVGIDSVTPPSPTNPEVSTELEKTSEPAESSEASEYKENESTIPASNADEDKTTTLEDKPVPESLAIPQMETPVEGASSNSKDDQHPQEEPHSSDHAEDHLDHDHHHHHHHPRNRHRHFGKGTLNDSSPTSSSIILVIKHLSSTLLSFLPEALQDTILDVDDALVFTGIIALTLVSICVPYIFIEGYMSVRPLKKKVVELNKSLWKVSAAYETQQEEFEIFKRKAIAHDEFKQKAEQSENDVLILKTLEKKHREQIQKLRTQLKSQTKEAVDIRAMIEKTLQDKKTVEGESTKYQLAAKNATEALTKAREELASFQTHAKSTALQLGMSSKTTEVLTGKISLLQLENEELKNQLDFESEKRKAAVEELIQMEESKAEAERELSENRRVFSQKSEEVDGLNSEIYRLESELTTIKETLGEDSPLLELAEVQAKAEFNEKEASSLRTRLDCVCADNERLRVSVEEKDKELEDVRLERETTTKRLQVLEGYFKEREEELLKTIETLQQKESVRDKGKDELISLIEEKEEDIEKLNETVEGLKEELEERKVQHRNEIRGLEAKGHENWLSLCQAERKSQDARKEAELLRQRLTAFVKEKERLEQEEEEEDDDDSGGDGLSGQLSLMFPTVIPHELVPPPILDLDDGIDDDDDESAGPPSYFGLGDFVPPPPLPDDEEEDYDDGEGRRVVGHRRRPPPLGGTRMSPSFSDLTDDEDEHNNNIRSRHIHRRREEEGCTDGSSGSGSPPIQGGGWMNIPQPGGVHQGRSAGGMRIAPASSSGRTTSTPNQNGANL